MASIYSYSIKKTADAGCHIFYDLGYKLIIKGIFSAFYDKNKFFFGHLYRVFKESV